MGSCTSRKNLNKPGMGSSRATTAGEDTSSRRSSRDQPKGYAETHDPGHNDTDDTPANTTSNGEATENLTPLKERRRLTVSTISQKNGELVSIAKKYADPAGELVDERKGTVREVTKGMIEALFTPGTAKSGIFGAPCWNTQNGFESKQMDILGEQPEKLAETLTSSLGYVCKKGLKPESPNQDDFFILRAANWTMYGVFDGHGPSGHTISHFVHNAIVFLIIGDEKFETDTVGTLQRAFRKAHELVESMADQPGSDIDCALSGTTCTIVVHRDNKLFVAHVGDSRAVLAQRVKVENKPGVTSTLVATNLTSDHKPTRPDEQGRIESMGGEVRRLANDIPHRVFVKGKMYPGLAMSRAIGDSVGATVGVTSDPDVSEVDLDDIDAAFLLLCTDGVWEFISSQEAVDMVGGYPREQSQKAAELLAQESWKRWVDEEETVVDDITAVVAWF